MARSMTIAATAMTHIAASMACAALRDLPSPLLMSASPQAANGTSRIKIRHSAVVISEITGVGGPITAANVVRLQRQQVAIDGIERCRAEVFDIERLTRIPNHVVEVMQALDRSIEFPAKLTHV